MLYYLDRAESWLSICRTNKEENIAEKGENVGYLHFLLFSQCF